MRHVNLSLSRYQCSTHCMRGGESGVLRPLSCLATQKGKLSARQFMDSSVDSPAPFIRRNMIPKQHQMCCLGYLVSFFFFFVFN